jgi:putative ABC transport system substrate-binding protein
MQRRDFITLLGGATAWPLATRAQHAGKVPRIGMVFPGPQVRAPVIVETVLAGLRTAGYAAPAQVELVLRVTDNDPARVTPLVAEIIASNVDVFFAVGCHRRFSAQTGRNWPNSPSSTICRPSPYSRISLGPED